MFNKITRPVEQYNLVVNLSNYDLSSDEHSVLAKGLKFCPTPKQCDKGMLWQDLERFSRSTRLALLFHENENIGYTQSDPNEPFFHKDFKRKSTWNPPGPHHLEYVLSTIQEEIQTTPPASVHPYQRNLTPNQYKAISSLRKNTDIVIKEADKGSAVVVQNTSDYINEGLRQLNDTKYYEKQHHNLTQYHHDLIQKELNNMLTLNEISRDTYLYLTSGGQRTSEFYMLPKIHKNLQHPPGRPIVSGNDSPSEKISQFVDHIIKPFVFTTKSYIRDTTDFINKLSKLDNIAPEHYLVTLDVTSLYTNIPHTEGIRAIAEKLAANRVGPQNPSNQSVIKLLKLVLESNNFKFHDTDYLQVNGTAMGTKLAPSYANLFMDNFEIKYVYSYHKQPTIWVRFIDDIFFIWPFTLAELLDFIEYLNSRNEHIKFTVDSSINQVNFLDTIVRKSDQGRIITSLYNKPTDTHSYLLYSSAHTNHTKDSIPYSQFIRVKRICSEWDDFVYQSLKLCHYLYNRDYPLQVIFDAFIKALVPSRESLLSNTETPSVEKNTLYLVTEHNPSNPNFKQIIDKHWPKLDRSVATRALTDYSIVYSKRRPPNLKDLLVRAKLPNQKNRGSNECQYEDPNDCAICPILNKSGKFYHHPQNATYITMKKVCCTSSNVVYLLECQTCKLCYIGETKRNIAVRIKEHLYDVRRQKTDTSTVARHFTMHQQTNNPEISVSILQFIKMNPDLEATTIFRKQEEKKWIARLNTLAPNGLNIMDK